MKTVRYKVNFYTKVHGFEYRYFYLIEAVNGKEAIERSKRLWELTTNKAHQFSLRAEALKGPDLSCYENLKSGIYYMSV